MNRQTALQILRDFQEWRRYDGPITDSPPMHDPKIIGQAIDVAIEALVCLTTTYEKEYYGC